MEENITMTYNTLNPRKSPGKSNWAETGTPNTSALNRQRKELTEIRESLLCNEKRIFHDEVWKVCLLHHFDYLVFKVNMHSFKNVIKTLLYANHIGVVYKSLGHREIWMIWHVFKLCIISLEKQACTHER